MKKERFATRIAVYLLLEKDNKILFHLRQNSGYADGYYSFVAGHLEDDETLYQAMVREAREEIGIELVTESLEIVHVMHRLKDPGYIDFFIRCKKWSGEIQNCEPHKCKEVMFFSKTALPDNVVPYIKKAIGNIDSNTYYSEIINPENF